jgi:hypothetical protein
VAAGTVIAGVVATNSVGLPFRDPDHDAAVYVLIVGAAMALLVGLDIALRAARSEGTVRPSRAEMRRIRRERWTPWRGVAVVTAMVSFYLTYMAYRNLKAIVPLLEPRADFDRQLADLDRDLFGGHDPAALLHSLLGSGVSAHVLSTIYVAFIVFLPLTLALVLVFARDLQASLFYATALSINWVLGIGSYLLLPSLGPVFAEPDAFAHLPHTEVTYLQQVLIDQRVAFMDHPATATPQAVAAFASLHIAMSATAVLTAHLLGLGRRLKLALWIWLGATTTATIYLGWHYVLDDLAGLLMGVLALVLARVLTGFDLRSARQAAF